MDAAFFPGFVMSFREGLEAFLLVSVLINFLGKSERKALVQSAVLGAFSGACASVAIGILLSYLSRALGGTGAEAKLWESGASIAAIFLVTTLIVWMIGNSSDLKGSVERDAKRSLTGAGIFILALVVVAREGVEIAIFSFAGKYSPLSLFAGIASSLALSVLIFFSLVRVRLGTIFRMTLAYLILQAGFLLGYGIHEGLSASKELGIVSAESPLFAKAFDLSGTILDHKEGAIGIPLYIAAGWYSRPEWVQLVFQLGYVFFLFLYWKRAS